MHYVFLSYRVTLQSTTGHSQAELLFNPKLLQVTFKVIFLSKQYEIEIKTLLLQSSPSREANRTFGYLSELAFNLRNKQNIKFIWSVCAMGIDPFTNATTSHNDHLWQSPLGGRNRESLL